MTLSAVLPLSIHGSYDVDDLGRARLLLSSLSEFAAPGTFETFLIVMPGHQIARARPILERISRLNVRVIDENEVVPSFPRHRKVRGWRKQQLIKIGAARYFDTDFFVTFDADIVALRGFDASDLVRDTRAVTQYCRLDEHPRWWSHSARILSMPEEEYLHLGVGLHATPAVLSTEICRRLMDTLHVGSEPCESPPAPWHEQLLSLHGGLRLTPRGIRSLRLRKWTEYSLYYLFAIQAGLWSQFHTPSREEEDGSLARPVFWYLANEAFSEQRLSAAYQDPDAPPFALVGTKGVISTEAVARAMQPHVGLSLS